jgi:hypothetical protein
LAGGSTSWHYLRGATLNDDDKGTNTSVLTAAFLTAFNIHDEQQSQMSDQ